MKIIKNYSDIVYLSLFSRLIIFIILAIWPLELSSNRFISPLKFNDWVDFETYYDYFNNIKYFFYNYQYFFSNYDFLYTFPGPIFPILLHTFDYKLGNTLLFSGILVTLETLATIKWAKLINLKFKKFWVYIFIFNPLTIYISYLVSPDIIFYFVFTYFYISIINDHSKIKIIFFFLILSLIKPHGLFFLPFIIFLIRKNLKRFFFPLFFLNIFLFFYYLAYAIDPMLGNSKAHFANDFSILFSKIKELFFFKESESLYLKQFYLIKFSISSVLVIGFIYSLRNNYNFLLIIPYILIILAMYYPTWRYIFFFTPIFYINFIYLITFIKSIINFK